MDFPVAGVHVPVIVPPLVGLLLGAVTSTAGLTGAFLLLPFQVTVLGFATPAVTPTNHLYNIVGTPGGIYRYGREGRVDWTLALALIAGTVPGVFAGMVVRLRALPDPATFKLFVAAVLAFLAVRLAAAVVSDRRRPDKGGFRPREGEALTYARRSWRRVEGALGTERFGYSPWLIALVALVAGVVSGAYGVGGGAIMGPVLVSIFALPVHATAGATLVSTLAGSVTGVLAYSLVGPYVVSGGVAVAPDWLLGSLFGIGGLAGTYLGARLQKWLRADLIKGLLALILCVLVIRYVAEAAGSWAGG